MKKSILTSVLSLSVLALALPASVQAITMEQSQEFSSSSSMSITNGSGEASTNQSGKQLQRIEVESSMIAPHYSYRAKPAKAVYVRETNDGSLRVNWGHRGGTCHVRYTEATQKSYRYSTSAGCDDGGVTIGSLTSGKWYQVQVRKDDGAWSRAFKVRAW